MEKVGHLEQQDLEDTIFEEKENNKIRKLQMNKNRNEDRELLLKKFDEDCKKMNETRKQDRREIIKKN